MFEDGEFEPDVDSSSSDYDEASSYASQRELEEIERERKRLHSGSMIAISLKVEDDKNSQTKLRYLKRLQLKGKTKKKRGRKARNLLRDKLDSLGMVESTKRIVALQSSSEEVSDDDDYSVSCQIIDWEQASWGKTESLLNHLSLPEISSLIGWAHNLQSDEICDPNPLLGIPDSPFPPSILEFIRKNAYLAIKRQNRITWIDKKFLLNHPRLCSKTKKVRQDRVFKNKSYWNYKSNDETYDFLKNLSKENKSVTRKVPSSCAPLHVKKTPIPLDISGRVALGMVIEEMITHSFLPLAKCHIASCRRKADNFNELTMPLEEVILSSKRQFPLLSAIPVDCESKKDLSSTWCNSRGLDTFFVQKNMHLYSKLLPSPPSLPNRPMSGKIYRG
jgi:hypothetical protein